MTGRSGSAREILKEVLQGKTPSRPLFVPIVFRLGARVENLTLRAFLGNATKISNSLRQIHSRMQADGVSCYCDPFLEVEALGGTLEWPSEQGPAVLRWAESGAKDQATVALHPPDEFVRSGRIPVALEVVRRLKTLLHEDFLLMAGVCGPFTLASRLSTVEVTDALRGRDATDSALEIAGSAVTQVSKAFAEAGGDLIFFREASLPFEQPDGLENWIALLRPIFNIVRFYEALPVLQIADEGVLTANVRALLEGAEGCVVCASPLTLERFLAEDCIPDSAIVGLSLPVSAFLEEHAGGHEANSGLTRLISDLRPALVTTTEDVPLTADLKRLAAVWTLIRG